MAVKRPTPAEDQDADPKPLDYWGKRDFKELGEGHYTLTLPNFGVLTASRLRRERHELIGELKATCELVGARTFDGVLSTADFNFSSARARKERAGLLAERARARDFDFVGFIEELCIKVFEAERRGTPPVVMSDVDYESPDDRDVTIYGVPLSREDATILFGDGGTCKSYLALSFASELVARGELVLYCDWEGSAKGHRQRLERMYPGKIPPILYLRCERSLVDEADRIHKIMLDNGITFVVFDSIGYGCDGPPESAETALRYFRAVRQLGPVGLVLLAHITKSDEGDKRPFGSAFWHNSARSTWHIKRTDTTEGEVVPVLLTHRKCNIGRLLSPVGLSVNFDGQRTVVSRMDPGTVESFVDDLPLAARITTILLRSKASIPTIAQELGEKEDSVRKAITRSPKFIKIPSSGGADLYAIKAR